MEKGFRTVQCSECNIKLKFTVSEKDYGKIKKIRCPKCKTIGQALIPHPPEEVPKTDTRPPTESPLNQPFDFNLNFDCIDNIMKNKPPSTT